MSCWGSDSLRRAQATDHCPNLLLRRQRQAKLLVSSKHLQDQLHLQVRLQRAFLRRCSELFRCSIWDKKKEKSVVMESANWKQSTQNYNCEENAALTLSRFERTALKSIQAGVRCVLQAVKWGMFSHATVGPSVQQQQPEISICHVYLYRSRLADFISSCHPEARSISGCLRESYADCLLSYSGLIGEFLKQL